MCIFIPIQRDYVCRLLFLNDPCAKLFPFLTLSPSADDILFASDCITQTQTITLANFTLKEGRGFSL